MNFFLLDAPALVSRYSLRPGYPFVDQLLAQTDQGRLCCSILSLAEVVAAFARMRRLGLFTPVLFAGANLQFRLEIIQSPSFTKLPLDGPQVEASLALIDKHRLDGYPGILLRVCLDHAAQLRPTCHDIVLVSSVKRLLQVARAEGLLTFNPEIQTQKEFDVLVGP